MRIVITELAVGTCDLTRKQNVECVRLQFEDRSEISCVPAELIKEIRRAKKKEIGNSQPEKKGN